MQGYVYSAIMVTSPIFILCFFFMCPSPLLSPLFKNKQWVKDLLLIKTYHEAHEAQHWALVKNDSILFLYNIGWSLHSRPTIVLFHETTEENSFTNMWMLCKNFMKYMKHSQYSLLLPIGCMSSSLCFSYLPMTVTIFGVVAYLQPHILVPVYQALVNLAL